MPISAITARNLLNYHLDSVAYTPATTPYMALATAPISVDDTAITEAAWTTYARQLISFGAAVDNAIKNDAVVTFPVSTVTDNTIVAIAIFSLASGGTLLWYTNLCKPIVFKVGDPQLSWAVGAITVRLGPE
jgi:hypothetical protein